MKRFNNVLVLGLVLILLVSLCKADPWTETPNWISSDDEFTMSVALADLNGDGYLDLVAGNYKYPYTFPTTHPEYFGETSSIPDIGAYLVGYEWDESSSTFYAQASLTSDKRCIDCIAIADYDSDGDLDIAVGFVVGKGKDGGVIVLKNQLEDYPGPTPEISSLFSDQISSNYWDPDTSYDCHCIRWVDYDSDGDLDLATLEVGGVLRLYPNDGLELGASSTPIDLRSDQITTYKKSVLDDLGDPICYPVTGTTMEFGDINGDGYLDVFVNVNKRPTIFKNDNGSFDSHIMWTYEPDPPESRYVEDAFCGSFGFCTDDTLALVVGSFIFIGNGASGNIDKNPWGNDIYTYDSGAGELDHVGQSLVTTAQPATDIQWAHLGESSDTMDVVAVAYPAYKDTGDDYIWDRGLEQIHFDPYNEIGGTDVTFPTEIFSETADLSTSLALGDIDGGGNTTGQKSFDCYDEVLDSINGIIYLDYFPLFKVDSVKCSEDAQYDIAVADSDWCVNLVNGWVSIDQTFIDSSVNVWDDFKARVYYQYSLDYDLAVGNDGYNVVYFNDAASRLTYTQGTPPIQELPDTIDYKYVESNYLYPQAHVVDLMAHDGLGATEVEARATGMCPFDVDDYLNECSHIKRYGLMPYWSHMEMFQGHYFWNWFDQKLDIVEQNSCQSHLCSWDTPFWTRGNYTYSSTGDNRNRTSDECLHTMWVRNLVNRYRPDGLYDQYAVGGSGWDDWGVAQFQFENEPNCGTYGYGFFPDDTLSLALNNIAEKMFREYQMIKKISINAYSDQDSLEVITPNFANNWPDYEYLVLDLPYLNALNSLSDYDHVLWNYCDYICQQSYCGKKGDAPAGQNISFYVDYRDPFAPVPCDSTDPDDPRRIGMEHLFWGFYTEGLDEFVGEDDNPQWQPVMEDGNEHPFFIMEWFFHDYYGTLERDRHWSAAQIAEMFSVDVFPDDPDTVHRLLMYNVPWLAMNPYHDEVFETCASMIFQPDGDLTFYSAGDVEDVPQGEPAVHRYSYRRGNYWDVIHFLRTDHEIDEGETAADLYVQNGWNFYLWNTDYTPNDKVNCYTPSGMQFQKEVHVVDIPDTLSNRWIYFEDGEMGPGMLIVKEELIPIEGDDYSQGLQLHEGWNLVSWHIEPVDDYGPYLEMIEILDTTGTTNDWFHENEGELYKWNEADLNYPDYPQSPQWEWDLDYAYYIYLDESHFWEFEDQERFDLDSFTIEPDSAWNEEGDYYYGEPLDPYTKGWFFMGYAAPGYCKLGTVFNHPSNPHGHPDNCSYLGPFHWLMWDSTDGYTHFDSTEQYLVMVTTDEGNLYIPKDPDFSRGVTREIDQIGQLEPGRGYFLGFRRHGNSMTFEGWDGYPNWSTSSIPGDPKETTSVTSSANHFQFKKYTHWFYPVVIDTIDLEESPLASGDEIAIFDGNLCVGAAVYEGEFPLVISCWKDDIATLNEVDGYESGNPMTFVWFDVSENQEITFETPPMIYSEPDDPIAPTHSGFGAGFYALRSMYYGIESVHQLPKEYKLGQNYPNPFNAQTVIPLELPQRSFVKIELFNVAGRSLGIIHEGVEEAGWPRVKYNASHLSSGVYFYRITADGLERGGKFVDVGKLVLVK
ncbi:hypothetical protein CEE37_05935 [candidate division LCP-89 bacterium B3_LCP]|uniref:Secretion system C-terminal sorting domain-containing protein n=1 Tax=candidate division LCP-89 bacterium B3_LCP TaxID=2012998 RepID=A0A532V1Z3_UNCL8|nr:MAG: hypothetical protein CEE37_05935 [candidate division LCP-89 bacterium B3_LCP]